MTATSFSYRLFLLVLSVLFLGACSSSRRTLQTGDSIASSRLERNPRHPAGNEVRPNENHNSNLSLSEMLRKVPGVAVTGTGTNARVTIRGASTLHASNEPLYVLDGTQIGHDFYAVASAIDPNEIESIHVLKGADAAIYGVQAGNGVIMIRSK